MRRPRGARARKRLAGSVAAMAAMAALTASQAPGTVREQPAVETNSESEYGTWAEPPNDDSYHTELPPLRTPPGPIRPGGPSGGVRNGVVRTESGIPATVLAAYRHAQTVIARTDPGCRLPWQLLAAIGRVESGQARGGRVDASGTTLSPILGPVLDGNGFATIRDTDGGAYDGDRRYDRAVGPMQFIPSTWARWGQDANGDGRRDPGNIHDAALAAGRYLCAGDRDLTVPADLDRAILSYNHSRAYLRTVLAWLDFYKSGAHPVPDGTGVLPGSPGAGGRTPAVRPVGKGNGSGGGIVVGPTPTPAPTVRPRPTPGRPPGPWPPGGPTSPPPTGSPDPSPSPDPTPSPDPSPTPSPTPSEPSPCPSPDPTPSPQPSSPEPSPSGSPGDEPCSPLPG
ncbi:lytic transglycosylase domain-containing protein [Streptomyces sp. NPDC006475]|uniref:lytic transglycosylase domain-containing protein n=1 Tax=Streptomyces sp. NPDC006475 TaxID=3155719 RepID=UPI0033B603F2